MPNKMDTFSPASLAVGGVVVLITTFGLFKIMSGSNKEVENPASSEGEAKKEKPKTQIVSSALISRRRIMQYSVLITP